METTKVDYSNRITPENIISLRYNEVFVFGSNLRGFHGAGAALYALKNFRAILGIGIGLQGESYALPTKGVKSHTLNINIIKIFIDNFIQDYAKKFPELIFLVTPIGCGLAGYTPEDIAPLFKDAIEVENIHLPESFWKILIK